MGSAGTGSDPGPIGLKSLEVNAEDRMTISEARALTAESLLDQKRISLVNAIDALETVGYRIPRNERGKYRAIQPYSCFFAHSAPGS